MMNLFTIILDYGGGTYIKQVMSDSPGSALIDWATSLETNGISGLGPASKKAIIEEIKESWNAPVALDGIINTWCSTFSVRGKLALINIVKTRKQ